MDEAEFDARLARIRDARAAIVALLPPWRRGATTAQGRMTCPICGMPEALAYRRAAVNGHIAARCSTSGCVSWME